MVGTRSVLAEFPLVRAGWTDRRLVQVLVCEKADTVPAFSCTVGELWWVLFGCSW